MKEHLTTLYLRQDGVPGGDGGGAPASGTPAPAPATPAPVASPTPAEPSPAGPPAPATPPAPAPAGTPAPDAGTPPAAPAAPGSDVLTQAQGSFSTLEKSLADAFGPLYPVPAAVPPAGTPSAPTPPAAMPAPAATPPAAPVAAPRITVTPEQVTQFYQKYSDPTLNDQQSVGLLLEEAANLARTNIMNELRNDPAVLNEIVKKVRESGVAQQRLAEAIAKTVRAVEAWWKTYVPDANAEDLWAFGPIAERTHPVPPNATPEVARAQHVKQAFFCLQRYLAIRGVTANPANEAVNRGQAPVIPGGGGAPSAGGAGGTAPTPTFQEQLLANRRGDRVN
jgi:hypothetical protein